jgi:hypothetical protein
MKRWTFLLRLHGYSDLRLTSGVQTAMFRKLTLSPPLGERLLRLFSGWLQYENILHLFTWGWKESNSLKRCVLCGKLDGQIQSSNIPACNVPLLRCKYRTQYLLNLNYLSYRKLQEIQNVSAPFFLKFTWHNTSLLIPSLLRTAYINFKSFSFLL